MKLTKETFLQLKEQFSLGSLTTESIREDTKELSQVLQQDTLQACLLLQQVDRSSFAILKNKSQEIYELQKYCQAVIAEGNRIFLAGCGATGRLALSMEFLFRQKFNSDKVIGFMAGGDYALVSAIEQFEDNMEYGERQLTELGFRDGDLVVGITEGGETSFVIGATWAGSNKSSVAPYFLYCNPDHELMPLERSRRILQDRSINKLNLTVGGMALSGSTRMQATTVQMLAIGFALLYDHSSFQSFDENFVSFVDDLAKIDMKALVPFIDLESSMYDKQGLVTYLSDSDLAIAILTDTTERSPTFSLRGFERKHDTVPSLAFLCLRGAQDSSGAWAELLGRAPRCLDWNELSVSISDQDLMQFDLTENHIAQRELNPNHEKFIIEVKDGYLSFQLGDLRARWQLAGEDLFRSHLSVKILLNIHSTLVMGLQGRFLGNMMTWVRPSNMKLVDRAQRYIESLLQEKGISYESERVVELIFQHKNEDRAVVIEVLNKLGFFA
jgi:N-acetylmuramic acid 6-phosphate etherase